MITDVHSFVFEHDDHSYTASGKRGSSVTGLLQDYKLIDYSMVRKDVLEAKRLIGTAIDTWTEDFDRTGADDMLSLPESAEGYANAWMAFRRQSGFEIVDIQKSLMASIYGILVGGTPDRVMRYKRTKEILPDLKCCASVMPSWKVQTAGYEMLRTRKTHIGKMDRCSVQLFPDGKYDVRWYSDPSDGDAFLAILAIEAWKANHGLRDKGGIKL